MRCAWCLTKIGREGSSTSRWRESGRFGIISAKPLWHDLHALSHYQSFHVSQSCRHGKLFLGMTARNLANTVCRDRHKNSPPSYHIHSSVMKWRLPVTWSRSLFSSVHFDSMGIATTKTLSLGLLSHISVCYPLLYSNKWMQSCRASLLVVESLFLISL